MDGICNMKTFKKTIWDVSYELERIAEILFNSDFAHTNTIFDRARIEEPTIIKSRGK